MPDSKILKADPLRDTDEPSLIHDKDRELRKIAGELREELGLSISDILGMSDGQPVRRILTDMTDEQC